MQTHLDVLLWLPKPQPKMLTPSGLPSLSSIPMRPVDGFRAVIRLCLEAGYSDSEVRMLTSGNAARLMGLDEGVGL